MNITWYAVDRIEVVSNFKHSYDFTRHDIKEILGNDAMIVFWKQGRDQAETTKCLCNGQK